MSMQPMVLYAFDVITRTGFYRYQVIIIVENAMFVWRPLIPQTRRAR